MASKSTISANGVDMNNIKNNIKKDSNFQSGVVGTEMYGTNVLSQGATNADTGLINFDSAGNLSQITPDKTQVQNSITDQLNKLENVQNFIVGKNGFSKKYNTNIANSTLSDINNIGINYSNSATADLYGSQVARDNADFVIGSYNTKINEDVANATVGGLQDITSSFGKRLSMAGQIERTKRALIVGEAKFAGSLASNAMKYNLSQQELALKKKQLEFQKQQYEKMLEIEGLQLQQQQAITDNTK